MSERNREKSKEAAIWQQFLSGSQEEQPETYRLASPMTHLDENDPPCWFITGEKDDPSTHADEFRERMKELGIESNLTVIQGAPHPFMVQQIWFDEVLDTASKFFIRQLKNQKATGSAE
jgi:pectinesterase